MKINETTGLYENYGIWHIPFWQQPTFIFSLKVVAAAFIVALAAYAIKKYIHYKKSKKLSPWDQAFADLENLKKKQMLSVAKGKEFYLALSAILKQYLADRFTYDVLGKTDAEVVHYLQEHKAQQELIDDMQALVENAQVIKFANAQAAQDQIIYDYDRVFLLVKRSIPQKKSQ